MMRCLVALGLVLSGSAYDCSPRGSAESIAEGHDLTGKIAFFTGSDTGIGYETALALARIKASIIIANHNPTKGQAAAANITRITGNKNVEVFTLDLGSFKSVRDVAAQVSAKHKGLDFVIMDAGISTSGAPLTDDGFEPVMEVNYLGHFLLEQLLLPALRVNKGKLIHVASGASYQACQEAGLPTGCLDDVTVLEKLMKTPTIVNKTGNYGLTKFMQVYNALELAARENALGSGVRAYAIRPGFVDTPLVRRTVDPATKKAWCSWPICVNGGCGGSNPPPCPMPETAGACSPTYVAVTDLPQAQDGDFYFLCKKVAPPPWANPKANQKKLYDMSLAWTGAGPGLTSVVV